MAAFSEMHIKSDRFAEYVAELRAFSRTHRVACGQPEDLVTLLEALKTSRSFAADFGSMLRAIVLTEHFQASDAELLILVAVAWGGATSDESMEQMPTVFQRLGTIIIDLLRRSVMEPSMFPHETANEQTNEHPAAQNNAHPSEDNAPVNATLNHDAHAHPEAVTPDESQESTQPPRRGPGKFRPDPVEYGAFVPHVESIPYLRPQKKAGRFSRIQDLLSRKTSQRFPAEEEGSNEPPTAMEWDRSGIPPEPVPTHLPALKAQRPEFKAQHPRVKSQHPELQSQHTSFKAAEIVATALTGLVVALLFYTPSLPVYQSRVSVYLPFAAANTIDGDASSNPAHGSQLATLRNGTLAGEVAKRLLLRSHGRPILRQDAVSRGLRDLHLGGTEPILYADLVAETAEHVKVRRVETQNVYEISCDSWSPQMATTFCNELTAVLEGPSTSTLGTQPADVLVHTVDAATGAGTQIYPRWFFVGFVGLMAGILVGSLVGLIKQSFPSAISEEESDDHETWSPSTQDAPGTVPGNE
jgi:hypothetical protein